MELFEKAVAVAKCPHSSRCAAEFGARNGKNAFFAPVPSPDYIGRRYRGLVIVGGNPGLAHHAIHDENDARMFALQERLAKGDEAAFSELMAFLPTSMATWPQMVNDDGRARLQYDIEEVAYIDIVKCGTKPAQGDTDALFRGTQILRRCWETHTKLLLDELKPSHIVGLWSPIRRVLEGLGYVFNGQIYGYHSGARHLTRDARYANAVPVFDHFYGR